MRRLRASPGVHAHGGPHARARHRREHRDLLGRRRRPPAAAAISAPGAAAQGVLRQPRPPAASRRRCRRSTWTTGARQRTQIADIGGYWFADGGSGIDLTGAGDPQRLSAVFVTPGFFATLGVSAAEGRLPREDEMVRGGHDSVVVLSHGFWQRQFGASRAVVGLDDHARAASPTRCWASCRPGSPFRRTTPMSMSRIRRFPTTAFRASARCASSRSSRARSRASTVDAARAELERHRRAARDAVSRGCELGRRRP